MAGQRNGAQGGSSDPHRSKIYAEFSHLYDMIFQRIFFPRIASVIKSLRLEPGARVLEVGVGTGLSLSAYPSHCDVVGIDLAQDMLDQAQDKIREQGWQHISLRQMDALNLSFPDDSFDYVMAFHVVSVVPDATRLLDEARRVLRPNGTLVVINHFRSERPIIGSLVEMAEIRSSADPMAAVVLPISFAAQASSSDRPTHDSGLPAPPSRAITT